MDKKRAQKRITTETSKTVQLNVKSKSTKKLFIKTAITILKEQGLQALTLKKLTEFTGLSRGIFYRYFSGISDLLLISIQETDQWLQYEDQSEKIIAIHKENHGKEWTSLNLKSYFQQFHSQKFLQEISLLELKGNSDFDFKLTDVRELQTKTLSTLSEDYFRHSSIDIKMVQALLSGGINYIVLHSKNNDTPFFGVQIKNIEDQRKLKKTIEQIVNAIYGYVNKTTCSTADSSQESTFC